MEVLILTAAMMAPTVEMEYRLALLEAKAKQVKALDITDEERGRRIAPYIRHGMDSERLIKAVGVPCASYRFAGETFVHFLSLSIRVTLDNQKVAKAVFKGPPLQGPPSPLPPSKGC